MTNVMINKLSISNTVYTSHRILLEHLGLKRETTDTGFPALNTVKDVCTVKDVRIVGLGIYVSHYNEHERGRCLCTVLTTVSVRKYLAQPTETTGEKNNSSLSWEF